MQFRSAEKMDVIGHDDVPANVATMSIMSRAPFVDQNVCDLVASKKRSAIFRARCHKIDRRIYVDALQSSQVFVHSAVVAEGGDLGNLRCGPRAQAAVSAAAAASALRGEHRFGIGAGDFAYSDPADSTDERAG